jgi:hypothetical protein
VPDENEYASRYKITYAALIGAVVFNVACVHPDVEEVCDEIVVPMSTCVMDPGIVDVSYDQVNRVVIVMPVGGGEPLTHVFVGLKSGAEALESKEDDW